MALLRQTLQMQEVKRASSYPEPGQDPPPNFEELSPGYSFYRRGRVRYSLPHAYAYNPLLSISFEVFRPLGFAFWDSERLQAYGFLKPQDVETPNQDSISEQHFYLSAWQSILSPEELLEYERKIMERMEDEIW